MPETPKLMLVTVPCLADNYAFLLHNPKTGETACVDAPEARPILDALEAQGWNLGQILLTHHHPDHVQAVPELVQMTGARVTGAAADAGRLPRLDHAVAPGDRISVCGEEAEVIDVSGHTVGHIAYHFARSGLAFTGDSLMAAGCGRLFEGGPEMMWASLSRLMALPPGTLICSGHEYTTGNIRFALTIEPDNAALISRAKAVDSARKAGQATVPSTLSEELATNPFLRAGLVQVKSALGMANAEDAAVFGAIRARKDRF